MKYRVAITLPLLTLLAATTWAGEPAMPKPEHHHEAAGASSATGERTEATKAFEAANAKMHQDMMGALTGDPDVDFMRGMIPHHQGAIDMAEIVLKYGKDPETRKLAEEIVKAQTSEIAMMKAWLAKHDH